MLPGGFLHRLSMNLSGHKARSMECNATLGLRFRIWTTVVPKCSSRSIVPSYCSMLSGFHPKGMFTSIMLSIKGCQRTVYDARWCIWERLRSSTMLPVHQGVIPLGCIQARSRRIAHHCGGVWHKPLPNHSHSLALSMLPHGVSPSPRCGFRVVVECLCLS